MPDPMTEEAPYRVTSDAPPGLRMVGDPLRIEFHDDETGEISTATIEQGLANRWIDTAPVIRNRRKKATETVAPQGVYASLIEVIKALPAIGKNARNQAQQFNYRSIDEVLDHLNPLLGQHGVFFAPHVLERLAEQRMTRNNNTLWTVHLHVEYTFYAADGSSVSASAWGEGTDSGDKATSKAMTMAMKSCLMQVLAISDHEVGDPDGTTQDASTAPPELPADSMSQKDRDELKSDISKLADNQRALFKKLWAGAKIPPLDHPLLCDGHMEGIVTLMSQAMGVPPESVPDEAAAQT